MLPHADYPDSPALTKIKGKLMGFTGTGWHHGIGIPLIPVTDGVAAFAEIAKAYWFIDLIASYQGIPKVRNKPYQVWTIKVRGNKGVVIMQEDYGTPVIVKQEIPYTDFPDGSFEIWVEHGVAILPSEH